MTNAQAQPITATPDVTVCTRTVLVASTTTPAAKLSAAVRKLCDAAEVGTYELVDETIHFEITPVSLDSTDLLVTLAAECRLLPYYLEALCELMHDAYESAAEGAGWETQPSSRKPWADVPLSNKATMRVAVQALADALGVETMTGPDLAEGPAAVWESGYAAGLAVHEGVAREDDDRG